MREYKLTAEQYVLRIKKKTKNNIGEFDTLQLNFNLNTVLRLKISCM